MAKKKPTRLSSKLPLTTSGTLPKADVLERWQQLTAGKTIAMEPVPADKGGSSYEEDSIRLTGTLKFIDSMLSNLKSLLRCENTKTRLDIAFAQQKEKVTTKPVAGKYTVYIKVVEKVRTTRAKSASSVPVRTKTALPKAPGASPTINKNGEDALTALTRLGYSFTEAQRRLTAVIDEHGKALTSEQYIKLALKYSK